MINKSHMKLLGLRICNTESNLHDIVLAFGFDVSYLPSVSSFKRLTVQKCKIFDLLINLQSCIGNYEIHVKCSKSVHVEFICANSSFRK